MTDAGAALRPSASGKGLVVGLMVMASFIAAFAFEAIVLRAPFDRTPLDTFFQIADPLLLRDRLGETLWNLHSQPPLFNLIVGLAMKSGRPAAVLMEFELFCGLALYVSTFALMRTLGVRRWLAYVLATIFLISPGFIIYERWFYYTMPAAALLAFSALMFARVSRFGRWADGLGFFVGLAALGATWGLFHLAFLIVAGLLLMAAARGEARRRLLVCAVLPGLLLGGIYLKNEVKFGHFAVSTWAPMNIALAFRETMPSTLRRQLVAEGKLSPVSGVQPFAELWYYPPEVAGSAKPTGIPILDNVSRQEQRIGNYNHLAFLKIADLYARDNAYLLRHYPGYFVQGVWRGAQVYFHSTSDNFLISEALHDSVAPLAKVFDTLSGRLPGSPDEQPPSVGGSQDVTASICWVLVVFLPLLVLANLVLALRGWRSWGRDEAARARDLSVIFLCFAIAAVAAIGVGLNVVETNRIRFTTDALSMVLAGLTLERLLAWRQARTVRHA